jgi:hypothetical protein
VRLTGWYPAALPGVVHDAWYVVASDPREGRGLWLRYTFDSPSAYAIWGAWFSASGCFALRNACAAFSRTDSCEGEIEGQGHSLRWRLKFGEGVPAEDFIPRWLKLPAKLRESGFELTRPSTTVSGAVEVDGVLYNLSKMPAGQAHVWGKSRYPAWAWARCSGFAEDPEASIDLLDVVGPAGVRVPMMVLRFRGEVHRFSELPWIAFSRSSPAEPSWHFSAQDATLAIDGVIRASPEQFVQFEYEDTHLCRNSEIASFELRIRRRTLFGLKPELVLTSRAGSLEFAHGRRAGEHRSYSRT